MQASSLMHEEFSRKPSVFGIFTSPTLQFKRMRNQRNIFLPLTLLILLIIISSALISWNSLHNPALSMFHDKTGFTVPKYITFFTSFGISTVSVIVAIFFAPIFYKNIMIFFGVDINYKETFPIIIYASFVLKLGMLLNGLIAFSLGGYELSYTGLGAIATDNMVLHAIAQRIDIFNIWYYVLLGIGLKTITNLNENKLVTLIIVLFVFTSALASISGFMQEISKLQ
ncbi:YIP1 family protein [Bacillus mycoides]|uniref:Yip1 family protein n=1 Tax=Bacillus TaxID=1386 RepID=UPI0009924DA2|nr:Yip1 family protein [Bacillus mycoides]OOR02071.1 YIP1 family protein [Bacillus mycoides]HDR7586397.1 YIP1 family protein [Bacillus mycoides]